MARNPAVQLFSVRDLLAADPADTLRRIADLGFDEVEPFGFEEDPDGTAAAIAAAGLTAPTVHASLFADGPGHADALLAAAARAGVRIVIDPSSTSENWTDRAAVGAFAAAFGSVARIARGHGVRVGYHNHDTELASTVEGRPALEVFADLVHPEVVLQVDTYWAQAAGVAAAPLLERLGGRVASLHLKDGDGRVDAQSQVALGRGAEPLAAILAAAPRARRVIELDDPAGDVLEALGESRSWLEEHDR